MDDATRSQYEGFRPGLYIRLQIDNMPCEFVENFDASYPVVLGALLSAEQNIGYVQVNYCNLGVRGDLKNGIALSDHLFYNIGEYNFFSTSNILLFKYCSSINCLMKTSLRCIHVLIDLITGEVEKTSLVQTNS